MGCASKKKRFLPNMSCNSFRPVVMLLFLFLFFYFYYYFFLEGG